MQGCSGGSQKSTQRRACPHVAGEFGWLRSRPAASAKYTRYPSGPENLRAAASGTLLLLDRDVRPDMPCVSPRCKSVRLSTLPAFESKRVLERRGAAGPRTRRTSAFGFPGCYEARLHKLFPLPGYRAQQSFQNLHQSPRKVSFSFLSRVLATRPDCRKNLPG